MRFQAWEGAFATADHAARGELIRDVPAGLPDADYWQYVARAWQDSERQSLTPTEWRALLDAPRANRELLMTDAERAELAALPERVVVYRGINAVNALAGLSWTLDRDVAEQFAKRHTDDLGGGIATARVLRRRIIALFDARGERELLIYPRFVYNHTWERI